MTNRIAWEAGFKRLTAALSGIICLFGLGIALVSREHMPLVLITIVLTLLPWAIFFLGRWIALGFKDAATNPESVSPAIEMNNLPPKSSEEKPNPTSASITSSKWIQAVRWIIGIWFLLNAVYETSTNYQSPTGFRPQIWHLFLGVIITPWPPHLVSPKFIAGLKRTVAGLIFFVSFIGPLSLLATGQFQIAFIAGIMMIPFAGIIAIVLVPEWRRFWPKVFSRKQ